MKKPYQTDDGMDDMEWERARRVLATSSTLAEASNILEDDPTSFYRRRRKSDERRSKHSKTIVYDEAA